MDGLSGSRLPLGSEEQGSGGRGTAPLEGDGLMGRGSEACLGGDMKGMWEGGWAEV